MFTFPEFINNLSFRIPVERRGEESFLIIIIKIPRPIQQPPDRASE